MIDQIKGSWKLISIYYFFADGTQIDMYGENPIGILMYDDNGYMNAQLGRNHREEVCSYKECMNDLATKSQIFDSFMAYYGKYYEESPGKIIHLVEGCINPFWIGQKEIRYVDVQGDILKIWTPPTPIDGRQAIIEVFWQRIK